MKYLYATEHETCTISSLRPKQMPSVLELTKLLNRLEAEIRNSISGGYTRFQMTMAMLVELHSAELMLELKTEYPHLQLVCFQPYEEQANKWSSHYQERYFNVLSQADEVYCLQGRYSRGCMRRCNRVMVLSCSRLIAVYNNQLTGVVGDMVRQARKKKIEIVMINPYRL